MYYGLKCIERIDKQYQSSLSEWIRKVTESGLGNRQWGEKMRQKNRGEGERAGEERGAGRDEINGGEGGEGGSGRREGRMRQICQSLLSPL